ncbi:hypothetical protein O0L34_g5347 [Tuta absoluta]|nr:hypothetical protein O0L34_g5347 [Tuta absoluta]
MASSDPEIKDGFPIPVWLKNKPNREFEPFAASPPAPEDSFFFIRYPRNDLLGNTKVNIDRDVPKVDLTQAKEVGAASYAKKDWSNHTKPCQDVLHGIQPINTAAKSANIKPKPAGTDDGFKGEGAACGNSVVKVASQMISTRSPRGFTVASPDEEEAVPPTANQYNLASRRGSKSLPTSPTSRRKMQANCYFTSPFEPTEDPNSNRSWLTMALLGFKKDLTTSSSTLHEEDDNGIENRLQGVSLAQSVENLGPAPRGHSLEPSPLSHNPAAPTPRPLKAPTTYRPKPSELREMNFWSPTSM